MLVSIGAIRREETIRTLGDEATRPELVGGGSNENIPVPVRLRSKSPRYTSGTFFASTGASMPFHPGNPRLFYFGEEGRLQVRVEPIPNLISVNGFENGVTCLVADVDGERIGPNVFLPLGERFYNEAVSEP